MNETLTFADLQDTGNAQAHLVLLAVARCAHWETGECWPGVKTIAKMAKCSERTARSYIAKLKDDGFIETESRARQDGSTTTDLIRLVGYAEWIASLRSGGKSPKPKSVEKYGDIPPANAAGGRQKLQPPPASMLAGPPCKQVAGANEPSLELESNQDARTREAPNIGLGSGKAAAAQPSITLTPDDGMKWSLWLNRLSDDERSMAERSGAIEVTAYWPDTDKARVIRIAEPKGLTERSKAIAGD